MLADLALGGGAAGPHRIQRGRALFFSIIIVLLHQRTKCDFLQFSSQVRSYTHIQTYVRMLKEKKFILFFFFL